jgi:hypothetical protein
VGDPSEERDPVASSAGASGEKFNDHSLRSDSRSSAWLSQSSSRRLGHEWATELLSIRTADRRTNGAAPQQRGLLVHVPRRASDGRRSEGDLRRRRKLRQLDRVRSAMTRLPLRS